MLQSQYRFLQFSLIHIFFVEDWGSGIMWNNECHPHKSKQEKITNFRSHTSLERQSGSVKTDGQCVVFVSIWWSVACYITQYTYTLKSLYVKMFKICSAIFALAQNDFRFRVHLQHSVQWLRGSKHSTNWSNKKIFLGIRRHVKGPFTAYRFIKKLFCSIIIKSTTAIIHKVKGTEQK